MRFALTLLFALLYGTSTHAKSVELTVKWLTISITYPRVELDATEWADLNKSKLPLVDCEFAGAKTKCWKVRPRKGGKIPEVYGKNFKFVAPIAVLPIAVPQIPLGDDEAEPDYYSPGKEGLVSRLQPFDVLKTQSSSYASVLDDGPLIGQETQSTTFSKVSITVGGEHALQAWKSLLGKLPKRECLADDFCAVVLEGTVPGREVLTYCQIMNAKMGIGIPFNCQVVAYKYANGDEWFLLSYDRPEQCDGCGAVSGASCTFTTKLSLQKVADLLVQSLKTGRTNIELKSYKKTSESIELVGQNEGTPSRFYANYYDKSFANYSVGYTGEAKSQVSVAGLFNLLISVEPVAGGKSFREIGSKKGSDDPDIIWFQGEVLAIVKKDIADKLGVVATCEVLPIY